MRAEAREAVFEFPPRWRVITEDSEGDPLLVLDWLQPGSPPDRCGFLTLMAEDRDEVNYLIADLQVHRHSGSGGGTCLILAALRLADRMAWHQLRGELSRVDDVDRLVRWYARLGFEVRIKDAASEPSPIVGEILKLAPFTR